MKEEMLKALKCLYIAVQEDIAKDVETKVMNYVKHLEERCGGFATNLYRVRKERNDLREELEKLKELHTLNFMSDMPTMEKLQKQRDKAIKIAEELKCHCFGEDFHVHVAELEKLKKKIDTSS